MNLGTIDATAADIRSRIAACRVAGHTHVPVSTEDLTNLIDTLAFCANVIHNERIMHQQALNLMAAEQGVPQ